LLFLVLLGAKKSLYGLEERIASLRVAVPEKRAEAERMKREHRLSSVINVQVRRSVDFLNFESLFCSVYISS